MSLKPAKAGDGLIARLAEVAAGLPPADAVPRSTAAFDRGTLRVRLYAPAGRCTGSTRSATIF